MEKLEGEANSSTSTTFLEIFRITVDLVVLFVQITIQIIYCVYELIAPPKEAPVSGEIVLITGTGHGIGKELAKQYGELGAEVVCVDVNEVTNRATVAELKKLGIKAHDFTCDVCCREKVLDLGSKVRAQVGDVTILVNNAGIMPCKKFLAHTPEEIKKMFDVNVFAHFWMLEAFLPSMMENDKGHIVGISSVAGLVGSPHVAPYSASKYAVRGLMDGLAEEFRTLTHHNIKFTTIYPYITDTGLCKKPIIRFKNFMRILPPSETASVIIQAQRRGYKEATTSWVQDWTNTIEGVSLTVVGRPPRAENKPAINPSWVLPKLGRNRCINFNMEREIKHQLRQDSVENYFST